MRLLLMRHAESQGNQELRLQGRRDFPLTERGRRQARALAARLASAALAAVYSSPIGRALETARILGDTAGLPVSEEPRVQEYDFGEALSGLTWQEIRGQHPEIVEALLRDDSGFPRYPGEEGRGAFRERVCGALREIAGRHAEDQAVAVVTHAGPIAVFIMELVGRKYSRPIPFTIENASVTTVEFNAGPSPFVPEALLIALNDTCHLRRGEMGDAK